MSMHASTSRELRIQAAQHRAFRMPPGRTVVQGGGVAEVCVTAEVLEAMLPAIDTWSLQDERDGELSDAATPVQAGRDSPALLLRDELGGRMPEDDASSLALGFPHFARSAIASEELRPFDDASNPFFDGLRVGKRRRVSAAALVALNRASPEPEAVAEDLPALPPLGPARASPALREWFAMFAAEDAHAKRVRFAAGEDGRRVLARER